ncbi:MAG: sugar phosphate isomerase/epimerase [Lachnospiraceae bacterium]|nr:sugar phosphate isomerase/epimerase [Lachnospiraceae bacterium]MBQ7602106.1 sugar phosphate isomerase/epimerase [Lachnospiraceae bacterium]
MFRLSVQTTGIYGPRDWDETYRLIAETGFECADANLDQLFPFTKVKVREPIPAFFRKETGDLETLEHFKPIRDAARKYGITHFQGHAPFPSVLFDTHAGDEEYNAAIFEMIRKSIIGADYIDCRNLVIHPFFYYYGAKTNPQDIWDMNIDRYLRLSKTAKEYGVKICLENMFAPNRGKSFADICDNPYEAAKYVDTLNSLAGEGTFGFCFDTGHALVGGVDCKDFLTFMGDRITCLHVHDNDGRDVHMAPFEGLLDWERFLEGLAEIRFDTTMDFETHGAMYRFGPELAPYILKLIEQTGRMFARKVEELVKKQSKTE